MDAGRFDGLVRTLARPGTRRTLLGAVAGAATTAVAGPTDARHKHHKHHKSCKPPRQVCSGKCTNLTKDPHNCGRCGHACGSSERCKDGVCTCMHRCQCDDAHPCPGPRCSGSSVIRERCTDGACISVGQICGAGETCFQNACCVLSSAPACHTVTISNGCGGSYPPNCAGSCCGTGSGGALVCQTAPCP